MPNIKPISDLRNYTAVLDMVAVGSPVYLTKNGRGCFTIMDMKEQEEIWDYITNEMMNLSVDVIL